MTTMEKGVDFSVLVRGAAPERVFDSFATAEGLNQWFTHETSLETRPGGALVHLIENGYEDSPVGLQDLLNRAQGWGCVLTLLKFFVEHGLTY